MRLTDSKTPWYDFVPGCFWQRVKDSNPHIQSQSLLCYPYTNPLSCDAGANARVIIPNIRGLSRGSEEKNDFYFPVAKKGPRAPAKLLMGMVWRTIRPGPVIRVLNSPSPPNRTFLTPFTPTMSMEQVASHMAR